ncbi:hypothetical protein POTOM_059150 [Populus tomentosa]|uniref:inositol-1,3,4-trisphosphate 5/6-kinase n=1 Tax=Populus tomentosa TaxID=118781 RepID=A0A8X7XUY9_POPTO|nr:hypothetical protein POTOM_059150 [Populus tomentosa]
MADGSETSHKLYLVFDKEGLDKLESWMIIMQECVKRKSLPDIKEDKLVTLKGLLLFLQISNLKEKTDCGGGGEFDRVEKPLVDFVDEVAKAIKEETRISLLNLDVIRDARDANRYLIININYFPGYEKIPNYESVLTDFLLNYMEKNKSGDVSMEFTSSRAKVTALELDLHKSCQEASNNHDLYCLPSSKFEGSLGLSAAFIREKREGLGYYVLEKRILRDWEKREGLGYYVLQKRILRDWLESVFVLKGFPYPKLGYGNPIHQSHFNSKVNCV